MHVHETLFIVLKSHAGWAELHLVCEIFLDVFGVTHFAD